MHEFLDKLELEDIKHMILDTQYGIGRVRETLLDSDIGDYFDKFLEETALFIGWLYKQMKQNQDGSSATK